MGVAAQARVVAEHALLKLDHPVEPRAGEHVAEAVDSLGPQHPVVAEIVDQRGDDDEERHAEQQRDGEALHALAELPVLPGPAQGDGLPQAAVHRPEEQYRQPHRGVQAHPFRGPGEAHGHAAQPQGNKRLPQGLPVPTHLAVSEHEQVHQHDPKYRVAVDGGDAGLGEVHRIQRHQRHGDEGQPGILGQLLHHQVHQRHHQHAHQRPHEAPAEGRHAEELYADHHQHLAQGRVGPFVGVQAVQVLEGGAGVVDFIEVGAVQVAGRGRHGALFVDQKRRAAVGLGGLAALTDPRDGQRTALPIQEGHLVEQQPRGPGGDADVAGRLRRIAIPARGVVPSGRAVKGELRIAVQRVHALVQGHEPQPAEDLPLVVAGQDRRAPGFAVVGQIHREGGIAYPAVVGHAPGFHLPEIEHHGFAALAGRPPGLGRGGDAQVGEGHQAVQQRHRPHQQRVGALQVHAIVGLLGQGVGSGGHRLPGGFAHRPYMIEHADVRRRPAQEQGEGDVDGADGAVQPVLACLQVPVVGLGHAALEHQYFIQE